MFVLTISQLCHQERVLHPSLLQLSPDFGSVKTSVTTLEVRFSGLMRRCWVVYVVYVYVYGLHIVLSWTTHSVYMAPCDLVALGIRSAQDLGEGSGAQVELC